MSSSPSLLSAENLAIGFTPSHSIASSLSLSLQAGEIVFLLGRNGVGKTTLLRTLAGLLKPLSGKINYRGRSIDSMSVRERARQRGVLFPNSTLTSPTRVRELVALGRLPYADWKGKLAPADEKAIDEALRLSGCLDWQSRWVAELSDGEKQRVYLARTLAQGVSILLLDEPTAFIDLPQRIEVAKVLKEWTRQEGRSVILSTHDLDLAMATADRIWILERGGGWTTGIPEELAMSGTLGRVFESPDATIDRSTGRLVWCMPGSKEIAVQGEGPPFDWTMRALVRAGYRIEPSATWVVSVSSSDADQSAWSISHGSARQEINSIEELLDLLRIKHPPR